MALFIIAVAAVYLRVIAPLFSTAYMDESIYVLYGRMFLARRFEAPLDSPLQWSFGWYLWPAMAAIADRIGGLIALRETAAVLGTVTVAATYGFASRIFSRAVGLGAAAVMAVLAPAVLVSKIATRDSGAICFVALGLWVFACGWREEKKRWWLLATLFFFAAFLCKYLIAIYFPLLVLAALKKGKKPLLCFSLPLFLCCVIYGAIYHKDILYLLRYASAYGSLKAPGAQALGIYFWGRWDFWLLCLAALPVFASREWRAAAALLWTGTLVMLLFQWKTRADYDYWKHVNYSLLFLVPLAVAGVVFLATRLQKVYYRQMLWGVSMVVALAGGVFFLGLGQSVERFVFWPNVSPILAYFENRLTPNDKILVDDTVLRYYFSPPLHQYQIVDPMYIQYGQNLGPEAYKSAVGERAFSYIVLDEGIGQEAQMMDAAIRPLLDSYQLELEALEPTLGHKIEIYAKTGSASASGNGPDIRIVTPASNSVVKTDGGAATVEGVATGTHAGWQAQLEVFTDRWYVQEKVPVAADGSFHQVVYISGEGRQQCYHLLRVRLFDDAGERRAVSLNYGITRANPDGSLPSCKLKQ